MYLLFALSLEENICLTCNTWDEVESIWQNISISKEARSSRCFFFCFNAKKIHIHHVYDELYVTKKAKIAKKIRIILHIRTYCGRVSESAYIPQADFTEIVTAAQ